LSSTNKTGYLGLNSWLGSDVPNHDDFNADNRIVDDAVRDHNENEDIHTTADEKAAWNQPFVITSFTGNGNSTRNITITNSFEPSWGIIFKAGYTPTVVDIDNRSKYNYFGFFTKNGSNIGLTLSGKKLTVTQSAISILGNEMRNYNENGSPYVIIAFR